MAAKGFLGFLLKRHPLDFAFNPFDFVGLVAKVMSEKATGFDWRCRSRLVWCMEQDLPNTLAKSISYHQSPEDLKVVFLKS